MVEFCLLFIFLVEDVFLEGRWLEFVVFKDRQSDRFCYGDGFRVECTYVR